MNGEIIKPPIEPLEHSDNGENKNDDPKKEERNRKLGELVTAAETLDDLRQQYDDVMEQVKQAQEHLSFFSRPLTHSTLGDKYKWASVEEARAKISKLEKVKAILEQAEKRDTSSYTDDEKHNIGLEIVGLLRNNIDQLDVRNMTFYKTDDGNYNCDYGNDDSEWRKFWTFENDTMSAEAWAYYHACGAHDKPYNYNVDYKKRYLLPEVSGYFKELKQRQDKQRRQEREIGRAHV